MPLRVRFVSNEDGEVIWHHPRKLFRRWKEYYLPPLLLLVHFCELYLLLSILFRLVEPMVTKTFLIRSMFVDELCPPIDLNRPFSRLSDIQDYIDDQWPDNFAEILNDSFMNVTLVDPTVPYGFTVSWANGTTLFYPSLDITIELFQHIDSLLLFTNLNVLVQSGTFPGCTHWGVGTSIHKSPGSYTFTASPVINRTECSQKMMASFSSETPQAALLGHLSLSLFVLAVIGACSLAVQLRKRLQRHNAWRADDPGYRDCPAYEQIHYSIGFWHPIHFVMELILVGTAGELIWEARKMTQYVSMWGMRIFSIGFFAACFIACQWFRFSMKTYELVLIIRVSFMRLVSILIGLLPLICALMMIGLFLFGLVSDISKTYYRFVQLFLGLIFGDDMYAVYSYYTDGTPVYTYMAFVYVTATGIVAGYIFFPAFTATISHLRHKEVVPIVEGEQSD
jgi:hypothetical protein